MLAQTHMFSGNDADWIKVNGIVVLTDREDPIITILYDIDQEGVSFLYAHDCDILKNEQQMDIVIFDNLTNIECLLSQVRGYIASRDHIFDPQTHEPILRFYAQFFDLDFSNRQILGSYFDHKCR